MNITPLTACHLCQWPHLTKVLDLGTMACTGIFPKPGQHVPEGPLEVVTCDACGLAQLGHVYPLQELYGEHYGYRSGLNPTMVAHLKSIAAEAWRLAAPDARDFVVDIGSNDGTLLNVYPDTVTRVAFDPLIAKYADHYQTGIHPFAEFFTPESALKVPQGKAAIVTSIACFYDLPDPVGTARAIAALLKPGGIWVVEVADLHAMVRNLAFDQVVQEHVEYYRSEDVMEIAARAGLSHVTQSYNDVNGGSVCEVFRKVPDDEQWESASAERPIDWPAFQHRIDRACADLWQFLDDEDAAGRLVAGYGASTKGNVILQRAGITSSLLSVILDANPDKDGCETPGTHIPIRYCPAPLVETNATTVLVLPWHFRDYVIQREREFLLRGGRLVFALPTLDVVTKESLREVA